jgi:hypothetical protein
MSVIIITIYTITIITIIMITIIIIETIKMMMMIYIYITIIRLEPWNINKKIGKTSQTGGREGSTMGCSP